MVADWVLPEVHHTSHSQVSHGASSDATKALEKVTIAVYWRCAVAMCTCGRCVGTRCPLYGYAADDIDQG